jgi:hypothetical protein
MVRSVDLYFVLGNLQGWGNAPSVAGPAGTANFSTGALQSTLRTGAGPAAAGITISPGDINYVVERCEVSLVNIEYVG